MGAKVHYKSYIPGYYTMRDPNENICSSWSPYYENRIPNGHLYSGSLLNSLKDHSVYDKEMLKRTMLDHEAIFRKQVYELHRLYRVQKDLMKELQKNDLSSFYSSRDQSKGTDIKHIGSVENKAFERENEIYADFGTCAKRIFDLRLPADMYIDMEDRESKDGFVVSSSVNSIPFSTNCNAGPENEVSLSLANVGVCEADAHRKNNIFKYLAGLNEPIEEAACSFAAQFLGTGTRLNQNVGPNFPLNSTKPSISKNLLCDESGSSNTILAVEEENSQAWSLLNSEAGQCTSAPSSVSGRENCSISHGLLQLKLNNVGENLSTDMNNADAQLWKNCATSGSSKKSVSNSFPIAPQSDINGTPLSLFPNWMKPSSVENHSSLRFRKSLNHGFDLDSYSASLTNLTCDHRILDARESTRLGIQDRIAAPKIQANCDVDVTSNCSNTKKILGFPISDEVHPKPVSSNQGQWLVDEKHNAALSRQLSVGSLDLNCEIPFMEDPNFSKMPANTLAGSSAQTSDSIPDSKSLPLIDLAAPVEEDAIRVAAESIVNLSFHKSNELSDEKTSSSLNWFADLALKHSGPESQEDDLDLFELTALHLKEMNPQELWCRRPLEAENTNDDENSKALLLLQRPKRVQARKKRQIRDFQKDILPGIAKLSRQEMIDDIKTIGEMMKASGILWESASGKRNVLRNGGRSPARIRRRPPQNNVTEVHVSPPHEIEIDRVGIIGWGRRMTARRCRPRRYPQIRIPAGQS